jgi:hypothetical protein
MGSRRENVGLKRLLAAVAQTLSSPHPFVGVSNGTPQVSSLG